MRTVQLATLLSTGAIVLCSCSHHAPPPLIKSAGLQSHPPVASPRAVVPARPVPPPVVPPVVRPEATEQPKSTKAPANGSGSAPNPNMSGGAGSAGTAGPGNGQGTPAAASAGSTGSGPGSASAASSGNGQGTTAAVSGVSTGSQAGQGHSAPLGDPSRKSAGAEEELRIPAAAKKGPTMETQKQPEPSTVDEAGAKRAAAAAVPVPQVEVRAEDIERLPPERRAALMRYLRQIQSRRAATAPTEGK